jgi:hypothetical protein
MDINNPKHMLNPKNPKYLENIKIFEGWIRKIAEADKNIKKDFSINK